MPIAQAAHTHRTMTMALSSKSLNFDGTLPTVSRRDTGCIAHRRLQTAACVCLQVYHLVGLRRSGDEWIHSRLRRSKHDWEMTKGEEVTRMKR